MKVYAPTEAAKYLGVTTWVLAKMRRCGQVEGTFVGNTTLYTEEQLKAAVLPRPYSKKTLKQQSSLVAS
jgi:hypothetical protein